MEDRKSSTVFKAILLQESAFSVKGQQNKILYITLTSEYN